MKVSLTLQALTEAMNGVASVVSDRLVSDDLKNLIFWVKENKLRFGSVGSNMFAVFDVNAELDMEGADGTEVFEQLRIKDINDALATLKGLKRTFVSKIEFSIVGNEGIMYVYEEPIDETLEYADKLRCVTKTRINKSSVKPLAKDELHKLDNQIVTSEINSADLSVYLDALIPTVANEQKEQTNTITFTDKHIFSFVTTYAAIMENKLQNPEIFSGFRLSSAKAIFLKSFIAGTTTFGFEKTVPSPGGISLKIKKDGAIASILTGDLSRAMDITNYVSVPVNGLIVDKYYMADVLKRFANSSEPVNVDIKFVENDPVFLIFTKNVYQEIPVLRVNGEGRFQMSMKLETLTSLLFQNGPRFDGAGSDYVFLFMEHNASGNVTLAFRDNSALWQTRANNVLESKSDAGWGHK